MNTTNQTETSETARYAAHKYGDFRFKEGRVWWYRGYTLSSFKKSGWNIGSTWTATKEGEDGITAHTKRDLMRYVNHRIDNGITRANKS